MQGKAIIYSRFSPRRNADDCESCETQIDYCQTFCKFHKLEVVKVYRDENISGSEENRPILWDAIAATKRGYALVVHKFDRLARNAFLMYSLERQCSKKDVKIMSASGEGTIERSMSADERLKMGLLRLFAEYERAIISARTSAAMLRHQRRGRKMGGTAPYGTMVDPKDGTRLIKNSYEQKVIKRIWELKHKGLGLVNTCKQLDAEGFRTRTRKKFYHCLVQRVLRRGEEFSEVLA